MADLGRDSTGAYRRDLEKDGENIQEIRGRERRRGGVRQAAHDAEALEFQDHY